MPFYNLGSASMGEEHNIKQLLKENNNVLVIVFIAEIWARLQDSNTYGGLKWLSVRKQKKLTFSRESKNYEVIKYCTLFFKIISN